ncbi:MAG: glycosyltransferase family 39 protein [Pleurocapsa minor GSE-CHR-MK-17-07R]|nr:glycosyltransferase family 39 protein [Pleurocapsa minor GSE-CHR-MK 17-07R]
MKSEISRRKKALSCKVAVAVLLLFWLTRMVALNAFPPFVDEAFHINFGNLVREQGLLARAEEGRQFTVWLYVVAQAQTGGAPVFVARVATILSVLPGVAAAIATARLLAGGWSGVLAALLFTFSAYNLFFDRLALADPVSASAVLVGLYFAARLWLRAQWLDAVLCGVVLFVAVGAKVSALPYLGIPLAAALTLKPPGRSWRENARWGVIALLAGLGLSALFLGVLLTRGIDPFFYLQSPSSVARSTYLDKWALVFDTLNGYAGTLMAVLLLAGVTVLLLRRRLYLPLVLIAPLIVLSFSGRQDSRHIIPPLNLLILCGAVAVESISVRYGPLIRRAALAVILGWAVLVWLPFAASLTSDPLNLSLTTNDRNEYITAEGSGFGLHEALEVLREEGAERVIGLLANCLSLRYIAIDLVVDCPRLNPNGEDIPALAVQLDANRAPHVYAVLEDLAYAPDTAPGRLVAEIEGAPGRPLLRVYALGG